MDYIANFLNPVENHLIDFAKALPKDTLGRKLVINPYTFDEDLNENSVVIIGVPEDRNSVNNIGTGANFEAIRKQFYKLYFGSWKTKIYDLGDIRVGSTCDDTAVAVQVLTTYLLKKKLIPIIIGGSQAITFDAYRAFDSLEQKVNLAVVDAKFDLGDIDKNIDSQSYLTKIVMEKPNNLSNFSNIGYQTFLNSQNEIDLIDTLLFDAYRLGEVKNNIEEIEPILREAHILSIDMGSVKRSDAPANINALISGFSADDICRITRYAGLSDNLSILGIFEYNDKEDNQTQTAELIAQMLWYFVEGVNYRSYEFPTLDLENFRKYMVVIDEDTLNFYKSNKSGRWWLEINIQKDNKSKRRSLVPCTYNDYLIASQQSYPKRWLINRKKVD